MTTETRVETAALTYRRTLDRLVGARQAKAAVDERVRAAREAWEAAHASLLAEQQQAGAALDLAETGARGAALVLSEETGAKTLDYGVVIRESERLIYDAEKALAWARSTGIGLTLDKKAFEGVAKVSRGTTPDLAFVTVEPTRTVALPNTERLAAALAAQEASS